MTGQLHDQIWIPAPRSVVFSFFSDERNLEKITPPELTFKVVSKSTPQIQEGTLIDYRLKIHGVPVKWRTQIRSWVLNERFMDTQLKGPYALWEHEHLFFDEGTGTRMVDQVKYRLYGGKLAEWTIGGWVAKDVARIFAFRKKVISDLFLRS